MRLVRRLLVFALLLALLPVGTALANHLDPQKKILPADQARARAMLLKKADLGLAYRADRSSSPDTEVDCAGLDESDLTVTGEAESPTFTLGLSFLSSVAQVYESLADANASWKRGTGTAGTRCIRETLRREFAKQGLRLQSFRKIVFPRVSQQTVAYRIALSASVQGQEVPLYVDLVVLMQSRAHVALYFGSGLAPAARAEELRLARLAAGRMAKAMRGS